MEENDYLKLRVNDQIEWHDKKSTINKRHYYAFSATGIVLSIVVPVLIEIGSCKIIAIVLSLACACTISLNSFFKFGSKWRLYRGVANALIKEKMKYETKSGIYANSSILQLVDNVEELLSVSNEKWAEIVKDNKSSEIKS